MKNDYCIIKVYAETNNEYVVKDGLTFDEAQEAFERYNNLPNTSGEAFMYIIGDNYSDSDYLDESLLDEDEDEVDLQYLTDVGLGYSGYTADDNY